ncbi:hypothetical protein ACTMS0_01430 [Micromonospora sp. H33]|uniref:hypothetical protein n=1 Tax=Micromonospora sp. H33 TaxID=3452215 RepID=UPI003F893E7E
MAQWWELAIPAGSTLAAAISTGWITASFQKRNGERLLRLQAEENEKARQVQIEHDKAIRVEELRKAREARTHEERKSSYVEFWTLSRELKLQEVRVQEIHERIDALVAEPGGTEQSEELAESLKTFAEESEAFRDLIDRQISAMTSIIFVGSPAMQRAGRLWVDARNRGADTKELELFESAFCATANYELSEPNQTMDLMDFYWKSLDLYFKNAGRSLIKRSPEESSGVAQQPGSPNPSPSRLPSTRPPGERATDRPATSRRP